MKGVPNHATTQAREAVAMFVEGNVSRLQTWLDEIAKTDGPKEAFRCFMDVVEYHIPKLARTETKLDAEVSVSYVAHMPAPVKDADDWLERSK